MTSTLPSIILGNRWFALAFLFLFNYSLNAQNCTNLLDNPSFEMGLSDWSTTGNVEVSTTADVGMFAAELCGEVSSSLGQIVSTTPGTMYRARVSGKILNPNTDNFVKPYILLRFLDANYSPLTAFENPFAGRNFPSSSYIEREVFGTAPANAAWVHVFIWKQDEVGGCLFIDNAELCEGIAAPDTYTQVNCPYDKTFQAETGQNGATVEFFGIGASTPSECTPNNVMQTSGPASGSFFPIGTTEVCFTANNSCDDTETCCFNIIVEGDILPCTIEVESSYYVCTGTPSNPEITLMGIVNSSTGNPIDVSLGGMALATIPSGVLSPIMSSSPGAIPTLTFTDSENTTCSTSSVFNFPGVFYCIDLCSIATPIVSNVSCTADSVTFDVIVTGTATSGAFYISTGPGISESVLVAENTLSTVTMARFGNTTTTIVVDAADGDCYQEFSVTCPTTGGGVDLELTTSGTVPDIWQQGSATFTLTNNGDATATGIELAFAKNGTVNITSTPTVSQGASQQHWTATPRWVVGDLAVGESAMINFPIFTLSDNVNLYGQVITLNENDSDSTPNNGNGTTPIEDDEASFPSGNTDGQADLIVELLSTNNTTVEIGDILSYGFQVTNQGTAPTNTITSVRAWISTDNVLSNDDLSGGQTLLSSLDAGETTGSLNGETTVFANLTPGIYYLILNADQTNEIEESNENNNTIFFEFEIVEEAGCSIQFISAPQTICSIIDGQASTEYFDFIVDLVTFNLSQPYLVYHTVNGEFRGTTNGYVSQIPIADSPAEIVYYSAQAGDNCSYTVPAFAPTNCGDAPYVDVELTTDFEVTNIYSATTIRFTVTNAGVIPTTDVKLRFDKNSSLSITNYPTTSQGLPNLHWTENPVWHVGALDAGQSATIDFPVFITANYVNLFAEVVEMSGSDIDSNPNNGNGTQPQEDDEASAQWVFNNTNLSAAERLGRTTYLDNIYPNPVYFGELNVQIHSNVEGLYELEVYDILGQKSFVQLVALQEGRNDIILDIESLASGTYTLELQGEFWRKMPMQFVVARW